jgi:hypothetical protein
MIGRLITMIILRSLGGNNSRPSKCDLYDVTLGNSAILQKQDPTKEAQQGILRPVVFRLHLTMGLAFYRIGFELPTGKTRPLGAEFVNLDGQSHSTTSRIAVR